MTDLKTDCATSAVMVELPSTSNEVVEFLYQSTVHGQLSALSESVKSAAGPNAELVEALKAYRNAQAMHPDMYRREDALRDADELARAALAAAGVQP